MQQALAETTKPDELLNDLQQLWLGWFSREHPCLCPIDEGKVVVVLNHLLVTREYVDLLLSGDDLPSSITACGFIGYVISGNTWSMYDDVCYFADSSDSPSRPTLTRAVQIDENLISIATPEDVRRFREPPSFLWHDGLKAMMSLYNGEDEVVLKIPHGIPTY
jgi:hypothetical protein